MNNRQELPVLTKSIVITNLTSREVNGGKTIFEIFGNDGKQYSTWDEVYFNTLALGQTITINYSIVTTTGKNGRVYSNNRLVSPGKASATKDNNLIMAGLKRLHDVILERLDSMEKNILARLDLSSAVKVLGTEEHPFGKPTVRMNNPELPIVNMEEEGFEVPNIEDGEEAKDEVDLPF